MSADDLSKPTEPFKASRLSVKDRFLLTASYVTIFPLSKNIKFAEGAGDEDVLSGLAKFLPAAGVLVGCLLGLVALFLTAVAAPAMLSGVVVTIAWLIFTGGLHFDGLMDTADGIFSHRDRQRMLEIMQDPRAGNFAVLAGMAVFALKVAALSALFVGGGARPLVVPVVLIVLPAWARLAEAYAIGRYQYAKPDGKGKVWHATMKYPADLAQAAILPALLSLLLSGFGGAEIFVGSLSVCLGGVAAAAYLNSRLGGHTGDTYGTVVEVSETIGLIALALFYGLR
jgi:adenosylcobinamide-GDP ribazoletransferase